MNRPLILRYIALGFFAITCVVATIKGELWIPLLYGGAVMLTPSERVPPMLRWIGAIQLGAGLLWVAQSMLLR